MKVKSTAITAPIWGLMAVSAITGKIALKRNSTAMGVVALSSWFAAGAWSIVGSILILTDRVEY